MSAVKTFRRFKELLDVNWAGVNDGDLLVRNGASVKGVGLAGLNLTGLDVSAGGSITQFDSVLGALGKLENRTAAGEVNIGAIQVDLNTRLKLDGSNSMTGPLSIGSGTVTASAPILNLSQTWNNAAVTFTGLKLNVNDTASASDTMLADFQIGGISKLTIYKTGRIGGGIWGIELGPSFFQVGSAGNFYSLYVPSGSQNLSGVMQIQSGMGFGWASGGSASSFGSDVILRRDAANTLALRNGTNAQAFNLYNTYTDASNYERGGIKWSSNSLVISTENLGTGTARGIQIVSSTGTGVLISGSTGVNLSVGGSIRWQVNGTAGNLFAVIDNQYDIGASGANRPKNIYIAGSFFASTGIYQVTGSGEIGWLSRSYFKSPANGIITLLNASGGFSRLQFGGTTASFPSIKLNGAAIDIRLADDSDYAALTASKLTLSALPTSDPASAGALWNDAGTVKISAG